jgi:flagellar biosynthesis/type III secretory pathway M-ring protein FliF/YscJ
MRLKAMLANLLALGRLRLAALGGVAAALLLGITLLAMRGATPPMALLYGDLDTRDAGAVVQSLERARIAFRITGGGTQIMVPAEDVARLRLSLAREGLPALLQARAPSSVGASVGAVGQAMAAPVVNTKFTPVPTVTASLYAVAPL